MSDHALFSPSGSHEWLHCVGSIALCKEYEDKTNYPAEEGTAAHILADRCISEALISAALFEGEVIHTAVIDDIETKFVVDKEMIDGVDEYLRYCREQMLEKHYPELRINYSKYAVPNSFGTSDYATFGYNENDVYEIKIVDLKYGKGVEVFAADNSQLKIYALGVIEKLLEDEELHEYDDVIISTHIVQPRLQKIEHDTYSINDLVKWGYNVVKPAAEKGLAMYREEIPIELTPGNGQCKFCLARLDCKANAEYKLKNALMGFEDLTEDKFKEPDTFFLTQKEKADLYKHHKAIIEYLNSIAEECLHDALKGDVLEGYKLVRGRSSRVYSDEDKAKDLMRSVAKLKVSEMYNKKLLSPHQLEQLIGKRHEFFEKDVVKKLKGKPTLVPMTDKRPSLEDEAIAGFENIETEDQDPLFL